MALGGPFGPENDKSYMHSISEQGSQIKPKMEGEKQNRYYHYMQWPRFTLSFFKLRSNLIRQYTELRYVYSICNFENLVFFG